MKRIDQISVVETGEIPGYQHLLLKIFAERKAKNPAYSLRAFARSLGVSKTSLSDTLAYKRNLSKKNLLKVASQIGLTATETELYLKHFSRAQLNTPSEPSQLVDEDVFHVIADWYHFGILSLAKRKDNRADANWISDRLGIMPYEAELALTRLVGLKLIEIKEGRIIRLTSPLRTTDDIPSYAIQKHHLQNLERAKVALRESEPETREFGSITLLGDPRKLKQAKKMIRDFQDKLSRYLEGTEGTKVYQLCIQLFPSETNGGKDE